MLLRSSLNDAARPFNHGPPTPGLKIYPLCPDPPEATAARTQVDAEHAHKYPPEKVQWCHVGMRKTYTAVPKCHCVSTERILESMDLHSLFYKMRIVLTSHYYEHKGRTYGS